MTAPAGCPFGLRARIEWLRGFAPGERRHLFDDEQAAPPGLPARPMGFIERVRTLVDAAVDAGFGARHLQPSPIYVVRCSLCRWHTQFDTQGRWRPETYLRAHQRASSTCGRAVLTQWFGSLYPVEQEAVSRSWPDWAWRFLPMDGEMRRAEVARAMRAVFPEIDDPSRHNRVGELVADARGGR